MIGTQFSHEEVLTGELNPESLKTMHSRFIEVDGTAEVEPPGQAQNAMQGYLHSQAVSDKVSLLFSENIFDMKDFWDREEVTFVGTSFLDRIDKVILEYVF